MNYLFIIANNNSIHVNIGVESLISIKLKNVLFNQVLILLHMYLNQRSRNGISI